MRAGRGKVITSHEHTGLFVQEASKTLQGKTSLFPLNPKPGLFREDQTVGPLEKSRDLDSQGCKD